MSFTLPAIVLANHEDNSLQLNITDFFIPPMTLAKYTSLDALPDFIRKQLKRAGRVL